jgi:hypothetical protein
VNPAAINAYRPVGGRIAVGALVLLGLSNIVRASGDATPGALDDQNIPQTRAALIAAGDADSLAAAGLGFGPKRDTAADLALLRRAAALASDRPDLVWLELQTCGLVPGCDPAPLAETLHRLDPENGAAWVPQLNRAVKLGSAGDVAQYVAAIGEAKQFDIYWNTIVAHVADALSKVSADVHSAVIKTIGVEAARYIPAFQNLSKACNESATRDPARLAACRGVARALRDGDTYITEMEGVAIAERVWPEGTGEHDEAVEASRVIHYRIMDTDWGKGLESEPGAIEYLALIRAERREQNVTDILIAREGKSLTPPPEWKDPTTERAKPCPVPPYDRAP